MQMVLLGLIFFIIGFIYKLFPPRKINWIYGWRTVFAMKNQDIWEEANRYGAILFICGGIFLALVGFLSGALFKHAGRYIFAPSVIIILPAIIIIGEMRLRKIFDRTGKRKI